MAEVIGNSTPLTARVLVVDDEEHIRESMGELLRLRGYDVHEAASGAAALAWLSETPCDLLLLDMVMPGMHGVEVMRRAREMRPDLAIIVLTAHATVDSAIASVKADVTDYMLKPCAAADLVIAVERALQERARQQRRQKMLDLVGEAIHMLHDDAPRPAAPAQPIEPAAPNGPALGAATSVVSGDMLRVGLLTLDRHKRLAFLVTEPDRLVELTEGEVSVLETLMKNPDQVLSISQLANSALGYQGMDKWTVESVVRSCVFRLRQKIEPRPDSPKLICTVRGRGYFFKAANGSRL